MNHPPLTPGEERIFCLLGKIITALNAASGKGNERTIPLGHCAIRMIGKIIRMQEEVGEGEWFPLMAATFSEELGCARMTVIRMIEALLKEEILEKKTSPNHRRRFIYRIAPKMLASSGPQ